MRPVAPRALALLVSILESSGSRLVEEALDPAEHDAFRALCDSGAVKPAEDVPLVAGGGGQCESQSTPFRPLKEDEKLSLLAMKRKAKREDGEGRT